MGKNITVKIQDFFATWEDGGEMKQLCMALYSRMASFAALEIDFSARPGVSYSIRMLTGEATILALLDVIDDDPADRWLSLCFPDAIISDPDEEGDMVPQGLAGKDARCFSIDVVDNATEAYMAARIDEAAAYAG